MVDVLVSNGNDEGMGMMKATEESRPQPAADLLWREIDDGVLLITPDGRIQALNRSASHIWQLIVAGQSVAEMKSSLLSIYGIPETEAEADILSFLDELAGTGMIGWGS
jgi:hypothetical protein